MARARARTRRGGARSGRPSPSRPRSPAGARRRGAARSPRTPRRRETRRTARRSPARRGGDAAARPPPATGDAADLALDEARDEVALRLDEGDDLRARSRARAAASEASCSTRRSIPSSSVSLPPIRSDERLAAGRHLEVVVRDPAAEHLDRLDAAGPHALDDRVDHDLTRSPPGSNSGSRRDLARDPLAEDLHLDRLSRLGVRRGQVGVGDRALDRVAVAAARHAPDRRALDSHRLRAERDRARVGEHEAAEPPLRLLPREQRLAADEVALVELDREPEPGLERRVVGRDVGAPHAVALLEPQRVDRLVAAGDEAVVAARRPRSRPRARARTRSGSTAPSRARRRT